MESASSSRANKIKTKGRGHTESNDEGKYDGRDGVFESIGRGSGGDGGPLQCKSVILMHKKDNHYLKTLCQTRMS